MSEQKRENGLLARGQSLIRDIVLAVFGNEALFLIVTFLYATLGDSAIVAWYREPMSLLYGYIVIPWGAALCLLRLQRRASSLEPARADVVTLFVLYLWILVPFAIRFGFTGKNVTAWHGYAVMFFGIYASISERKQREREMLMATMSVLSAVFAYVFCGALLFCAWSGTIYAADLGPFGFGAVEGWLCSGVHYNITGMIVISLCMMCVMGVGYHRNILLKLFCLIPAVMSMAVIVLTQSRTSRYALLAVLAAAAFDGVRRALRRRNAAAGLLAAVLGAKLRVLKTPENFNNDIGTPLTLLGLGPEHQAAVIETGMDRAGQIRYLGEMVKPDIAVITNVGDMHIEYLGSRENILKAKCEIFENLKKDGLAVLNGDDKLLNTVSLPQKTLRCGLSEHCDVRVSEVEDLGIDGIRCVVTTAKERYALSIPVPGKHMVYSAAMAAAIGEYLGETKEEIERGAAAYEPAGSRMHVITFSENRRLLDDCYNAGPQSMAASLRVLGASGGKNGGARRAHRACA